MCSAAVGVNVLLLLPWLPSSGKTPSTIQQTEPVKPKDAAANARRRPQSHMQTSVGKRLPCNWEPEAKQTASAEAFRVSRCLSISTFKGCVLSVI